MCIDRHVLQEKMFKQVKFLKEDISSIVTGKDTWHKSLDVSTIKLLVT